MDDFKDQFDEDGAVCLRGVFSPEWIRTLHQGVDRNIDSPGIHFADFTSPKGGPRCIKDYWRWEHIPEYQQFFRQSPAAALAGELLGAEEICFLEDQFFEKQAGAGTPSPWHQDQPYYEVEGRWIVIWIPLEPVSKSDCLELVAGSHRTGKLYTPKNFGGNATYHVDEKNGLLEPVPDIDAHPGKYRILSWDMDPGDCIAFHPRTIHGNKGNSASHRARRVIMRFVAEDATYDKGVWPWATLIEEPGVAKGDRLIGNKFPLVWTRQRRSSASI